MTSPADALNDAQLIDRVRADEPGAFAELRGRHQSDATRTARMLTHDPREAEQVCAAAFERLHATLAAGHGPHAAVSPHLRTMIRRCALDVHRTPGDEYEAVDPAAVDGLPYTTDPLTAVEERDIIREAYESLPERWQRALWFTEIEGRMPTSLVPDLGSTASAVAAMAYRAREGLRQAYLAVHMSVAVTAECQPVVAKLPAYVRDALAPEDDVTVAIHLDMCVDCRNRRYELLLLVSNLRSVLAPALLGYRAGTPAATRPVAGWGGAAAGVAVAASRAGRTSAIAAMSALGRWPRLAVKAAATAAVCVLAVAALAWAASSTFAPATPADAAGNEADGSLAVTFEETGEGPAPSPEDSSTGVPEGDEADPGEGDPADGEPSEAANTEAAESPANDSADNESPATAADSGNDRSTAAADSDNDPPAATSDSDDRSTAAADSDNNTSGSEPEDSSTTDSAGGGAAAGAGGESPGNGAGDGGNQSPPDGPGSGPGHQPVPPAGDDDGDSDDKADEPTDGPDDNPDEEDEDEPGPLQRLLCSILVC